VKKRVAIYGMNYAPEIAGVGRYTGEIGEHLASLGHDVCVITTPAHYPGWSLQTPGSGRGWTKETLAGATVYRCPVWLHPEMRGLRRLIAPLSFALSSAPVALWQMLTRRPDVVIAVEPTLLIAPAALTLGKLVGARTVLHVQDLEVDAAFAVGHLRGRPPQRLAHAFERVMMAGFDRVITISRRMAAQISAKGVRPRRIEVVRNWVDLDLISPMKNSARYRRELGLADDAFVVLYAGTVGLKQGVGLLVQAARELVGRPDIVLLIAGEGPMRAELEQAARTLPNLRVLGFQPQARFAEFLAVADAHVLPQERAAADLVLPSKLGGMLASGRPIIVTADPETELAEFLANSCTFTPPGDASALAGAIAALASERPRDKQTAERLARARLLSKRVVIQDFTAAALFLQTRPPVSGLAAKAKSVAAPDPV
jgi:colanic acid biosynthesis glycosyl transferase WcaI